MSVNTGGAEQAGIEIQRQRIEELEEAMTAWRVRADIDAESIEKLTGRNAILSRKIETLEKWNKEMYENHKAEMAKWKNDHKFCIVPPEPTA